jgi:hypothetical protein
VVQLGTGTGQQFGTQIRNLTVDAAGFAGIGILNNSAEEGSIVDNVNIFNAPSVGLSIQATSTTAPINSGPYRNINIQNNDPSCCGSSTIGLQVSGNATSNPFSEGIRGIDNVTVSGGPNPHSIGTCISIIGFPTQVTNSHVEYCGTGIQIGGPGFAGAMATQNVELHNVSAFSNSNTNWNVAIQNASDILLSGITTTYAEVLDDAVTGNMITTALGGNYYLGLYLLGDNTGSSPAVISTAATVSGPSNLKWVVPGDLKVDGLLSKSGGTFKIDDPLDPANKYLYHSFVESPDMMNVYNGSITTDKHGMAMVTLPDYFEALNKDFRYQLTAIGSFAQATVAKEIQDNHFAIRTSKPGVKVSWQVTGIRHDAYANAHRVQVEEQKSPREQGHYLHPELFDKGEKQAEQATGK